jgi:hypothetical protein
MVVAATGAATGAVTAAALGALAGAITAGLLTAVFQLLAGTWAVTGPAATTGTALPTAAAFGEVAARGGVAALLTGAKVATGVAAGVARGAVAGAVAVLTGDAKELLVCGVGAVDGDAVFAVRMGTGDPALLELPPAPPSRDATASDPPGMADTIPVATLTACKSQKEFREDEHMHSQEDFLSSKCRVQNREGEPLPGRVHR